MDTASGRLYSPQSLKKTGHATTKTPVPTSTKGGRFFSSEVFSRTAQSRQAVLSFGGLDSFCRLVRNAVFGSNSCSFAHLLSSLLRSKKEGVERARKKLLPVVKLFCAHFFRAYCVAFAEPAMSAKDSFKARRKTGDSRPAREVSKTLRQGVTQWAFSTKLQQHSQADSQLSRNAGSGKDFQEAAQQAGAEGNSQAENVRVAGSTVIVQPRKLLNERQRKC